MDDIRILLNSKILASIPRILSLLDKNQFSKTYGSFDRRYWQYKMIDFPCGMQQELALPLAYTWNVEFEGNKYYRLPRVRDYLQGIFSYYSKCCHSDGSLDDYFPHERAYGATAYVLAALTEAVLITGLSPNIAIKAFKKSGDFLSKYRESGKLSNHFAIAALALINLYEITGDSKWKDRSDQIINELSLQQHLEGWFKEYEGCDLGYQTVSVEFLARRYIKSPSDTIIKMLENNIDFVFNFLHPDGSFGGEYGSRNTYNFYPGGFAIMSQVNLKAAAFLHKYFLGLKLGNCNYLEDDGVFGHLLSSYVTVLNCDTIKAHEPSTVIDTEKCLKYCKGAGLFWGEIGGYSIFGSLTKGGVFKLFKTGKMICSDTGFVGELSNGIRFCQNNHRTSTGFVDNNTIEIRGKLKKYNSKHLGKTQMIGLRFLSIIIGWLPLYSRLIRIVMQKALIFHRSDTKMEFVRKIVLDTDGVVIKDEIKNNNCKIKTLYRSTDCTNMHVITSNSFQTANLESWEKLSVDSSKTIQRYSKHYS